MKNVPFYSQVNKQKEYSTKRATDVMKTDA